MVLAPPHKHFCFAWIQHSNRESHGLLSVYVPTLRESVTNPINERCAETKRGENAGEGSPAVLGTILASRSRMTPTRCLAASRLHVTIVAGLGISPEYALKARRPQLLQSRPSPPRSRPLHLATFYSDSGHWKS